VQPAFSSPADESTIEARLAEDADTAWFGEWYNSLSLLSVTSKGLN
jgi:hypothetical protein